MRCVFSKAMGVSAGVVHGCDCLSSPTIQDLGRVTRIGDDATAILFEEADRLPRCRKNFRY